MMKFACCPNFSWDKFITIISIVDVVVFIIEVTFGNISSSQKADFLQIDSNTV